MYDFITFFGTHSPSHFQSYYEPNAKRKNLVILLQSQVLKVELADKKDKNGNLRATGVTYQDMITNKTYTASVKKDVIVSGGGIQSPQMLELSGIGNKTLLESFGIKSRIDLPDVGENYQVSMGIRITNVHLTNLRP